MVKMKTLLCLIVGYFLSAQSAFAQQHPLRDPNVCGRLECKEAGKFHYRPGTRHIYNYAVNVSSIFDGTSRNESNLYIGGQVLLEFVSHCEGVLSLRDVTLRKTLVDGTDADSGEHDPFRSIWTRKEDKTLHANSQAFADAVSELSLRFAFHDGHISEVCPYEDDKNWVVNLKRGVLSMLHNTMRRFDVDHFAPAEEDVHGSCETRYRIKGSRGTSLLVDKTKDLGTCTRRSKLHSVIQSTPYNFRVNYRGRSLMRSRSQCTLSIDHRIYNDIVCEDSHVFEPLEGTNAAGAMTIVKQHLILVDEVNGVTVEEQGQVEKRSSLIYDHVPTPKPTSGELKASRDLIKRLCRVSADDVRIEFSDLFTKFIHTSRTLSSPALEALYKHAGTLCETGKKHVLDALPFLGSEAAVDLIRTVINSKSVPEGVVREWMLSVALIPMPSAAMIQSMYELLQTRQDISTTLAISSMAHTFCQQNEDCRFEDAIDGIANLLEDRTLAFYAEMVGAHAQRDQYENFLVNLKAVTNMGTASESFKEQLKVMIEDERLPTEARVLAVDAHRRLPCNEGRNYFEDIYRNLDGDSEVRIAAYLQVMRCPNYLVIRTIKHTLEIEEVNQVGSFVWSHLSNLLQSSIPSRVEIQGLLSDKDLTKKFSSDVRKFSHNFEGSVFFEEYNMGGNYESNVIFSPQSYIPRSAMLNLTVDLFGESINLFEIYGRLEGFEHYAESTFGPRGKYSAKNMYEKIPKMRWPREAPTSLDHQVQQLDYKLENDFSEPKLTLGLKLFGNDLKYMRLTGDEEIRRAIDDLNPTEYLKRILSGREINYNSAAMFLDTSYVVASGAGLPVTLNAVGTTSINLQLKGSLDADNFLQTKEMDIGASINPSAALDIVGTMSLDAYFASTAIKIKASVFTSSAVEAFLKIRGTRLISVKFGLPKMRNEIFGISSELVLVQASGEEELQAGITGPRKVSEVVCSWPAVENTVGLKMCAEYQFVNVTNMTTGPHFLMAGPTNGRLSLLKSNPSATKYLLEYKWVKDDENTEAPSYMSLTLDTPESDIPRIMGANLTIDPISQNLTLMLRSTEGIVLARGRFKNTDEGKYLQLGLDINNQRNFEAMLSLDRTEIKNGYMYTPKLYLGINEDRVAELQGSMKLISKAGISQYDVDLKFKTKRLVSKLFGYISLAKTSATSTLKLDYKFVNTREHVVLVDVSLARRLLSNVEVLTAEAKMESTAYPNYNFNSTLTFQRGAGHIQFEGLLHSSPQLKRNQTAERNGLLTMDVFLTYRTFLNGTRFKASASLTRPSTELDVKALLAYDEIGYAINAMGMARYGRDKDVIASVYWYHPHHTFELYEGRLNVTIPTFQPMVLEGKLKEKQSAEFTVELACSWFSGHKFEAKGLYHDRSTYMAAYHHLKLLVKSPSFSEINADCYYYRNNTVFKIDGKADQEGDQYALNILHSQSSPHDVMSSAKLLLKEKLYSIQSLVSLKERREVTLELHIDQLRDIFVSLWAHNKESYKEAGVEVKWDANRDPNQKLVLTLFYSNPRPYDYDASVQLSYPGRTVKAFCIFLAQGGHVESNTGIAWSPDESLSLSVALDFRNDVEDMMMHARSLVLTPFQDWRRTSLAGGFHHRANMYHLNGSMHWQHDQHVAIDLFGDYANTPTMLQCELKAGLDSTIRDVPSVSASIKHHHNASKVDSEAHVMYQPKQKIAVTSSWQIDEDERMRNLTGTMTLLSPFKGFQRGLLVSKIYFTRERDLRGVAKLDLDHREFTASVEGHFQKLSRSALAFNVTSPIEKYKLIQGRFGFSEVRRHLVAQVSYPSGKTGIEVQFLFARLSHFDILFNLATPLEFLQDVLIVGKLQRDQLDFRAGWNSLLLGVTGAWRFTNPTDFEYAYKVFTPIDGFEENGIVAKVIYKEGLDVEFSARLRQSKLGLVVVGHSNPKILKDFGIQTQAIYKSKLHDNGDSPFIENLLDDEEEDDVDDNDEEDEEEEDPFNWSGHAEVHTILYPTITAEVDVDQKGTVYDVVAVLGLPDGKAHLRNEFDFIDVLNMRNRLSMDTPYALFRQISATYEFRVMMGHQYLLALDVSYLNGTDWIKTGVMAHYFKRQNVGPTKQGHQYNATLHLHSPFATLPVFDVSGGLLKTFNKYQTNFSMATNRSNVALVAALQMHEQYLKADFDGHIRTPLFHLPASTFHLMKDFSPAINRIECAYTQHSDASNDLKLSTDWRFTTIRDMRAQLHLQTPFKGMEQSDVEMEVNAVDWKDARMRSVVYLHPVGIRANVTLKEDALRSEIIADFDGKRHLANFDGELVRDGAATQRVRGVIRMNEKKHSVSGAMEWDTSSSSSNRLPKNVNLVVHGLEHGVVSIAYEMQPREGGFVVKNVVRQGDSYAQIDADALVRHKFDWDLHLQIETSHQIYKTFVVNAKAAAAGREDAANKSFTIDAKTPFGRLEKIQIGLTLGSTPAMGTADGNGRQVTAFYDLGETACHVDAQWAWLLLENMSVKLIGNYRKPNYKRSATINAFYVNPAKKFAALQLGGGVDLDQTWIMHSNLTMQKPEKGKLHLNAHLLLPQPHDELHSIAIAYAGLQSLDNVSYNALYSTQKSGKEYSSNGHITYENATNLFGDVSVKWDRKHFRNYLRLNDHANIMRMLYKLTTPKFQEEALIANMTYMKWSNYHNVTGEVFYPGNHSIGRGHVHFKEFANMDGFFNASTPFSGFNYTAAEFATETSSLMYNRYLQIFWPQNNAFLNATCTIREVGGSAIERDTTGVILAELPLATRHIARVDYNYSTKPQRKIGHANVEYNRENVLQGKYVCESESRAGFDKDTIHVQVENKMMPIGADYVHSYEYGAMPADDAHVDGKRMHIYHLHNRTAFDVTGDIRVEKRSTGQEVTLLAIHSNRTVKFNTVYDILDQQFKQASRIEMSPMHWLAYDIDLLNNTDDSAEAQQILVNLYYPRRNFSALASYNLSDWALASDMLLHWHHSNEEKQHYVQSGFEWHRSEQERNKHSVRVEFKHPQLEKNVTILGEYDRNEVALADVKLSVDYSVSEEQQLKMHAWLEDHSAASDFNYTYGLWSTHPATNLQLDVRGGVHYRPRRFYSHHLVDYQRTYLPTQLGEATTRIDLDHNEIEMKRKTLHELSYFHGKCAGRFPVYTANVSAIHEKDVDATGEFYVNFAEKLIRAELNMTADGSQSMHVYGHVPDARSSFFDVWRDYDDDRVSDVSYFLRLNHSRLVVSTLRWRPQLKQDVKDGIRALSVGFYNYTMERSDYWRQYVRSEAVAAIADIWHDAEPLMQEFIDDVKDLRVIEDDLIALRSYLNDSYNANDFYIRDVVQFVVYVVDELSIRKHIESVPAIVSEIWEMMGESGEKIQKRVAWVLGKIKEYYRKTAEFVNALFQGDAFAHVTDALKQMVEKYDAFIKDLHVAFIRWMEELWKETYKLIMDNWHRTLIALEPKILTLVHYLETILWNAGTEILDFLYIRNSDIISNPYVSKISNLTHDLDNFYKDITGNDTLASIYKYGNITWEFLKDKYFKYVPFGREVQDVANEIMAEVEELKKLPSIKFLIAKYNQAEEKVRSVCSYFDLENRVRRLVTLLHAKLTDLKQTALQAENRYRDAKTKFFFEPADGIMHLEQKLPMSWHAFNETPKFQEIPEYRSFNDLQTFFSTSKLTFASFYHDYKPYTDPTDWLPPFKAQAMLTGSQYYVTFDGMIYEFQGHSTYLLARDFLDGNFTIAVSYTDLQTYDVLVQLNDTLIRINPFKQSVTLHSDGDPAVLPLQVGDAFVYQDNEIVTIRSDLDGFHLQCNMKFILCVFEVSGWYFGKTAGLWGTMNNELFDDLSTPKAVRLSATDIAAFAQSWALDDSAVFAPAHALQTKESPVLAAVDERCDSFYTSKVSPFASCFDRVPLEAFNAMCRRSSSEQDVCTSAIAYMKMCSFANTPLRIPDTCVKCNLVNGSTVNEGQFVRMTNESLPPAADIVFIVEAKECNSELRTRKRIDEFVSTLDKEMAAQSYRDNRYAVVAFGGNGVLSKPRSIVIDSHVFAGHQLIATYFDHITVGSGSVDIFKAITYATKLIFRPGASKTFVLLPCSDCREHNMTLDYTTIHQLLLENDISLHILMNDEFRSRKSSKLKTTFGVDRRYAYAKKDVDGLKGDKVLRKSVQLPKANLGVCVSLALETNGSLFAGKKLEGEKSARKTIAVFAKRVAQSAVSNSCKICECTAHNSGVAYMECFPCNYPTPMAIEFGDEDEMLAALQPDDDYLFDIFDSASDSSL